MSAQEGVITTGGGDVLDSEVEFWMDHVTVTLGAVIFLAGGGVDAALTEFRYPARASRREECGASSERGLHIQTGLGQTQDKCAPQDKQSPWLFVKALLIRPNCESVIC